MVDASKNMVFQIVTADNKVLTVHTEVGEGLTKVVVDEAEKDKQDETDSDYLDSPGD